MKQTFSAKKEAARMSLPDGEGELNRSKISIHKRKKGRGGGGWIKVKNRDEPVKRRVGEIREGEHAPPGVGMGEKKNFPQMDIRGRRPKEGFLEREQGGEGRRLKKTNFLNPHGGRVSKKKKKTTEG